MTKRIMAGLVGAFALLGGCQPVGLAGPLNRLIAGRRPPTTIVGLVADDSGVPLPHALVAVEGTRDSVRTGEDGTFVLPGVHKGLVSLRFSHSGDYWLRLPDVSLAADTFRVVIQLRDQARYWAAPYGRLGLVKMLSPTYVLRGFRDSAVVRAIPLLTTTQLDVLNIVSIDVTKGRGDDVYGQLGRQFPMIVVTVAADSAGHGASTTKPVRDP
ncbi:MAG TPA: carboxypeptidase-like regulatory domain-containing protein [Gemmatimonadaceae bacterium]|nr:carboxypeptidase-like regulatory domain-containing protein [Gemmatimonadaceae bacterium]